MFFVVHMIYSTIMRALALLISPFVLAIALLCRPGAAAADSNERTDPAIPATETLLNASTLTFTTDENADGVFHYQSTCRGSVGSKESEALSAFGIDANALRAGVGCVVGDFNNDLVLDFAFLKRESRAHKVVVFFYQTEGYHFATDFEVAGYFFYSQRKQGGNASAIIATGAGHMDTEMTFEPMRKKWTARIFANP